MGNILNVVSTSVLVKIALEEIRMRNSSICFNVGKDPELSGQNVFTLA